MTGIKSCQDIFSSWQKMQVLKLELDGLAKHPSTVRLPETSFLSHISTFRVGVKIHAQVMKGSVPISRLPPMATPSAQITLAPSISTATSSSETGTGDNSNLTPSSGLNPNGWTILHAATNVKSIEGVTAILAMGSDPNLQTDEGWTPIWVAACHGLLEISRLLLEAGANVNATDRQGRTPLGEAAQIGAAELVQLLIEYGANVNLAPYEFQDSPLIAASGKNHIEVVRILLAAGADSRAQQSGGWSPLHYALLNKNEDMATLILGLDPDINASTKAGLRPLHLAALAGFADICARLLDLGARTEAMDSGGLTALRVAVQAGQFETVKLLIERGSRTDVVGANDGHTLLEVALMFGHVRVYQYLEEQRAR